MTQKLIKANICRIPLSRGFEAIVDPADFEAVGQHKWFALDSSRTVYAARKIGKKTVYMHRVILAATGELVCDHLNGNGLDNRRANLRLCTQTENKQAFRQKKKRAISKYIGVCKDKKQRSKPWQAYCHVDGKQTHLGMFATEEEAARARDAAVLKHFGSHAGLNFPEAAKSCTSRASYRGGL